MDETVGKIYRVEQGMRRCQVCEELFTPQAAGVHFNEPCQPKLELVRAAAAGQSA
jgi:hypothetical protein